MPYQILKSPACLGLSKSLPLPSIQHLRHQGGLSPGFPGQCLGDSRGFCKLSYESEFA